MKTEYLLLNVIIIIIPLFWSFERKVYYVQYWLKVLISIGIVMIPFIIWDVAVTGIHWHFNKSFTLPFRFYGLPIEEIMFFISVPFSCLFIWQIIITDRKIVFINNKIFRYIIMILGFLSFSVFYFLGKIYTSIVCFALAFTVIIDIATKINILIQKRTYLYLLILTVLIFIFNGYLTARPIVLYDSKFISNIRIWTIPIEDFGYGYSLILLSIIIFERLKGLNNA